MAPPDPFYRWRPHPWHGLSAGPEAPDVVNAFIEITAFDVVKYEIDKASGYLCVDRPQRGASTPPMPYGFIPRTLCAGRVGARTAEASAGDGDAMDVCVVSERPITRAEVIVRARVLGGIRMLDSGAADDKIVAVLESDPVWHTARDLGDLPDALVGRLEHYLATYKLTYTQPPEISILGRYGREEALATIRDSLHDYAAAYGDLAFDAQDPPDLSGRRG